MREKTVPDPILIFSKRGEGEDKVGPDGLDFLLCTRRHFNATQLTNGIPAGFARQELTGARVDTDDSRVLQPPLEVLTLPALQTRWPNRVPGRAGCRGCAWANTLKPGLKTTRDRPEGRVRAGAGPLLLPL